MERELSPEAGREVHGWRPKSTPSLSLWELAAHPLLQNAMVPLPFTLFANTLMGITAETAGSWLSGGKSVLLWIVLVFIDFLMGDL